jgi:DnaJ-class molecular chaperone
MGQSAEYTVEDGGRVSMVDLYACLGVTRAASRSQIRRAWQRLAATCHPDRMIGEPQELVEWGRRQWGLIDRAVTVLCSPERDHYDELLSHWSGRWSDDGGVGPRPAGDVVIDLRAGRYLAAVEASSPHWVDLAL